MPQKIFLWNQKANVSCLAESGSKVKAFELCEIAYAADACSLTLALIPGRVQWAGDIF